MLRYIAAIAFCFTSATRADFVVYGEAQRPAWFDAVGGPDNVTTIGFTEYPNNTTISDQYANLGVTFEGLNFVSGPFPVNYHDSWGLRMFGTDTPGNDLYFDDPINWIAADYLGSVRFQLYSGDTLLFQFQRPLPETFSGVVSDAPFDRVRIYDPTDPLTVLDDLHFGPPIAVPAPGVLAMAPFALFFRRRRRS